ncbi:hypothetical protein HDU87_002892, partial [Geranomyces variabilis]
MTFEGIEIPQPVDKNDKPDDVSVNTLIDLLEIPQQTLPVPIGYDHRNAMPEHTLAMIDNPAKHSPGWLSHNWIWRVMCWAKQTGMPFSTFWQWNLQKNNTVERYKRWEKEWKKCNYAISPENITAMLLRKYPNIKETQVTKVFREQFEINNVKVIEDDFLKKEHISEWTNCKFTALLAPMGGNKTGASVDKLIQWLQRTPSLTCLWVTPRITLSQNTLARLATGGLNFVNYKDVSREQKKAGFLDTCPLLICSIQSLHYMNSNYDIIVADEWDTIAATFGQGCKTHIQEKANNIAANWSIWMSMLNKAKKVIFMDAFTTKMTQNFFEHFRQKAAHPVNQGDAKSLRIGAMPLTATRIKRSSSSVYEMVNLKRDATPRHFSECDNFKQWMTHIFAALDAGKKIYVFSPFKGGKKGVEYISEMIRAHTGYTEGKEIMFYYAEKEQEKKKLANVEKVWADTTLKCVVTNSAISVGVNFNMPEVFDQIFAFYTAQIAVRDFFQALYRVRRPKDTTMILLRDKWCSLDHYDDVKGFPDCEVFKQLRKDLLIEERANANFDTWETFNLFCSLANVTILPERLNTVTEENEKYIDSLQKQVQCVFNWERIPTLPIDCPDEVLEEFQKRIYSDQATLDDRLIMQKHCFMRKFKDDAPDETMALVWKKNVNLPTQLMTLKEDPKHIINNLLGENNVVLGKHFSGFPDHMRTSLPWEKIKKHFFFAKAPRDYKSHLCAKMLNAYFQQDVYKGAYVQKEVAKINILDSETEDERPIKKRRQ